MRGRTHSEVKVEKKELLRLLRGKLEGDHTASEVVEPLEYSHRCKTSAVLIATSEIDINGIKVTKLASKVLARQAGLSLDALSHCMSSSLPSAFPKQVFSRIRYFEMKLPSLPLSPCTNDGSRGLGGG